ncbi:MAG: 3-methyl-2-oxobutanoate hydroxymethyltransferase [Kiritimatiellia bacterium]
MKKQWTVLTIKAQKGQRKIACITAYDFSSARIADEAGIPLVLVGDSLGMTVLGYDTTLPVTMEEMLHHTRAVSRAVKQAMVVADMPFLSYQGSEDEALINAGRFLKEAGADAVKVEGGAVRVELVQRMVANGIPVQAHLGLTPQSVNVFGGFRVQAKTEQDAEQLKQDAKDLAEAGAFSLVLECIPQKLAAEITASINIPTIGIGAGPGCDGQVLVWHDLLGLYHGNQPRFVKRYAELGTEITRALTSYKDEVEQGRFPTESHGY